MLLMKVLPVFRLLPSLLMMTMDMTTVPVQFNAGKWLGSVAVPKDYIVEQKPIRTHKVEVLMRSMPSITLGISARIYCLLLVRMLISDN